LKIADGSQVNLNQVNQYRTPPAQRVDAGHAIQPTDRSASLDQIEVSELAQTLARVLDASEASMANEIGALKQAYAGGTLQTEPMAISRAMLQDAVADSRLDTEPIL
jgi:anti-sigma28 factor (negative regulator of flagellin synthesis)